MSEDFQNDVWSPGWQIGALQKELEEALAVVTDPRGNNREHEYIETLKRQLLNHEKIITELREKIAAHVSEIVALREALTVHDLKSVPIAKLNFQLEEQGRVINALRGSKVDELLGQVERQQAAIFLDKRIIGELEAIIRDHLATIGKERRKLREKQDKIRKLRARIKALEKEKEELEKDNKNLRDLVYGGD